MKRGLSLLAVLGIIVCSKSFAGAVVSLEDIHYWGVGSNRSVLVVDWNDGKSNEALAWGLLWDAGSVSSVADMLVSLTALDTGLFLRLDSSASYGVALFGVGYQSGSATFGITGAQNTTGSTVMPSFVAGVDDMNITNGATDSPWDSSSVVPLNPNDRYQEAWNTPDRYWTLFVSGSDPYSYPVSATPSVNYPSWSEAGGGVSGVTLVDNGWYALSYSDPSWAPLTPSAAFAAIPEPSSFRLLLPLLAVFFLIWAKKKSAITG